MAVVFGSKFKTTRGFRISTMDKNPEPKSLYWTKPTGNIGNHPSGYDYAYKFGVYDSQNAIERFEVIGGQFPLTLQLNPYSGEIEGLIPDVLEPTRYSFTVRVRTTDNRHLYGDFWIQVEYTDLVVNWITPQGLLGEYDLGFPVHYILEAKANK